MEKIGRKILEDSLTAIASKISLPQIPNFENIPIIIFNSLNWERSQVVTIDLGKIITEDYPLWKITDSAGREIISQNCENSTLLFFATVPSVGYSIFWLSPSSSPGKKFPKNWTL